MIYQDEVATSRNSVKYLWSINGHIRSGVEWCKIYNRSLAGTLRRMERFGCTPFEALTFPLVPQKESRHTLEWFKQNGFYPGQDKTSFVVPYEDYPYPYTKRSS